MANNCGNVVFSKFPNTAGKNDIDEGQAQNIVFDNQTDVLIFEAIENPFHVKGYALETRNKLKK